MIKEYQGITVGQIVTTVSSARVYVECYTSQVSPKVTQGVITCQTKVLQIKIDYTISTLHRLTTLQFSVNSSLKVWNVNIPVF